MKRFGLKIYVNGTVLRGSAASHSKKHIQQLAKGDKRQGKLVRIKQTTKGGKKYYRLYSGRRK